MGEWARYMGDRSCTSSKVMGMGGQDRPKPPKQVDIFLPENGEAVT